MGGRVSQSYKNHSRIVPAYHYVAFPLFGANFFWALYQTVVQFSWHHAVDLALATSLVLLFFLTRVMALTVQDRVIRLEMRLRMRDLLPESLQPRINEFSVKQLVALRFAGDEELPELARRVLDERLVDQRLIKQLVRNWQADHLRA